MGEKNSIKIKRNGGLIENSLSDNLDAHIQKIKQIINF